MREIKFRCWDMKKKVMVTPFYSINERGQWSVHNWEKLAGPLEPAYRPNVKIMQFTGLKDKNGKEIYEGDIFVVRELHDGDEDIWNNEKQIPIPQQITWNEKQCGFEFGLSSRITYQPNHFEVIGNIYENKKLLA